MSFKFLKVFKQMYKISYILYTKKITLLKDNVYLIIYI